MCLYLERLVVVQVTHLLVEAFLEHPAIIPTTLVQVSLEHPIAAQTIQMQELVSLEHPVAIQMHQLQVFLAPQAAIHSLHNPLLVVYSVQATHNLHNPLLVVCLEQAILNLHNLLLVYSVRAIRNLLLASHKISVPIVPTFLSEVQPIHLVA